MKKFCVIGHPIGHSLSPRLLNRWFRAKRMDARYSAVDVAPKELSKFMKKFRANFAGANVTIPHKQAIMGYLDWISPEAQKIGAVNTIIHKKGRLYGHNTDVFGAMAALKSSGIRLKKKHAVVLGSGGAARAVVYGLKKAGARVMILNRTVAHAERLARELGAEGFGELTDFNSDSCDVLVNTTSVGMWPHTQDSPLTEPFANTKTASLKAGTLKRKRLVVMDIIYRPHMTKLLKDARKAGHQIITGDRMFIAQAKKSFEYFSAAI